MKQLAKQLCSLALILVLLFSLCTPIYGAGITGECGQNLTWSYDVGTGHLSINGTGDMLDFSPFEAPWYNQHEGIKKISFAEGITKIGQWAFVNCISVEEISFPESLTTIGSSAFKGCSGLRTITLPSNLTSLGEEAFNGCQSLVSASLESQIQSIGFLTFGECSNLTTVTIPNSVTAIAGSVFFECPKLANIYYSGTAGMWNQIQIHEDNVTLQRAKLHFAEHVLLKNFAKQNSYTPGQFSDVTSSAWFASGVQYAYELGLMKGVSNTTFNPTGNLTVAEALVIACRIHSIYANNQQSFVQGSPWYQVYADYALENNIIRADQFTYTLPVTREQFAYIMCGALPLNELKSINTIEELPDVQEKSTYGSFVFRLYRAGVLTGNDEYGTYTPNDTIQRSAVATIIARMVDRAQRKSLVLQKKPIYATEIQLAGQTQITVGSTTTWTAKVLPEGAQTSISWTAGNPGVATVDSNGVITGHKAGQCHITATTSNGIKKTVMITVVSSGNLTAEQIFVKCSPAVFYLEVYNAAGKATSSGSGFFIDSNGTAVTNYHVIEGASSAKIMRSDTGSVHNVLGVYDYSKAGDWAVIKIEGKNFPFLAKGSTSTIVGGANVFAIGSPQGLDNTISEGIISNPNRKLDSKTYIQISAPISHGSSGGALINKHGEVIGITTAGIESGENLGFALPISVIDGYKSASVTPLKSVSSTTANTTGTKSQKNAVLLLQNYILKNANSTFVKNPMYQETQYTSNGYTTCGIYCDSENDLMLSVEYIYNGTRTAILVELPADSYNVLLGYFYRSKLTSGSSDFSGFASISAPLFNKNNVVFYETNGIPVFTTAAAISSHQNIAGNLLSIGLFFLDDVLSPYGYSRSIFGYN